jgi:hypothetical protein
MIKAVVIIFALTILFYLALFLCVGGITVNITGYKGDGTISKEGAGFIAKGYSIDFDVLKVKGKEYYGKYKIGPRGRS